MLRKGQARLPFPDWPGNVRRALKAGQKSVRTSSHRENHNPRPTKEANDDSIHVTSGNAGNAGHDGNGRSRARSWRRKGSSGLGVRAPRPAAPGGSPPPCSPFGAGPGKKTTGLSLVDNDQPPSGRARLRPFPSWPAFPAFPDATWIDSSFASFVDRGCEFPGVIKADAFRRPPSGSSSFRQTSGIFPPSPFTHAGAFGAPT